MALENDRREETDGPFLHGTREPNSRNESWRSAYSCQENTVWLIIDHPSQTSGSDAFASSERKHPDTLRLPDKTSMGTGIES